MSDGCPRLSIIVPAFNVEPFLGETLTSLLTQTENDFELILVDDGSTDATVAVAKSFADPRIKILEGHTNRGPAPARNRGLEIAVGHNIGFFDADDIASPTLISEELDFLYKNPDIDGVNVWHQSITADGTTRRRGEGFAGSPAKIWAAQLFENNIATSSVIFRRRAIESHRFDETFPVAEDYELWTRILASSSIGIIPKPLVKYRVHPGNTSVRKVEVLEDCLRKIAVQQLAKLNIEPTAEELDIHRCFSKVTFGTEHRAVKAAEEWLMKLDTRNSELRVYDPIALREVLSEKWFRICFSACGEGWQTWKTFHSSKLARYGVIRSSTKRLFFGKIMRGAVKRIISGNYRRGPNL